MIWLILCLLLTIGAIFLWPGVSLKEADVFVPIHFAKMPLGLTLAGPPAKGIEIRVRGPMAAIQAIPGLKLRYQLDLTGVTAGIQYIPVEKKRFPLPRGISIVGTNPTHLTVRIENETRKSVPVILSLSGKPARGFFMESAMVEPSAVVLAGPESLLATIDKIQTKPVSLHSRSESFKKEIPLDLPETLKIVAALSKIRTEIRIREKITTRKFKDLPVEARHAGHPFSITPSSISINVKGPLLALEKLQTEEGIRIYVDLKGLQPGVYVRRANIALPLNITLVDAKPEIFTVEIRRR